MLPSECKKGELYSLAVIGVITHEGRGLVGECIAEEDHDDHSRIHRGAWFRVVSKFMHGWVLKEGDYILNEKYDPLKHGFLDTKEDDDYSLESNEQAYLDAIDNQV